MLSSKPVATRKLAKLYDDIRKEGHKSNDSNGFYMVLCCLLVLAASSGSDKNVHIQYLNHCGMACNICF